MIRSVFTTSFFYLIALLFSLMLHGQAETPVQKAIDAAEQDALHRLWVETSAKWERNREMVSLFQARQMGMIELRDTTMLVRLMGFSDRGEPIYYQTLNLFAAKSLKTNRLWSGGSSELNLNGDNITLNIWDGGSIRHTHHEFGDRTTQMDENAVMNGHATHVAGTMVAAGMVPTAKGMAPSAFLHAYDFQNDEVEMIQAAADGAILSNHSYGRPTGWLFHMNQWWWYGDTRVSNVTDYKFGFYTEETRIRDEITYLAPFYLQVHAAGNDRGTVGPDPGEEHNVFDHDIGQWVKSTDYREPDGGYEGYDCISTLVLGKNVITVGSVHDVPEYTGPESVVLSDFSNTGPTDDGRIKPDVVANGQSLLSTWVDTNTSYVNLTGTSMAAPSITGSLGLIQQLNKQLYGSYLRASTLKALMIHTTREAGEHPGPDYLHGWGLADMEAAAKILPYKDNTTIIQERNLVQTVLPTYSRTVYAHGQQPLVATLAWTDVPGTPLEPALNDRTPMLVNDLDLRITRLSDDEVFYPWKLDPDNPSAPATQGDNVVDNVEKIEIFFPEPGQYLVQVSHKDSIVDPINATNKRQPFSLVISGIAERAIDLAIDNAYIMDAGCNFSEATPAHIVLANFGQQQAEQIPVSWQVKDAAGIVVDSDSFFVDELASGLDTILEVFPNLTQGLQFEFSATVSYPGDQLPANNTFVRNVVSVNWPVSDEVYHTDFDEILYIEDLGWHVVNANDNASGWMLRIATGPNQFASSGFNSMRYGKLNPGNDGVETMEDADDWLITSCFYLLEGENYRLSFDYRAWDEDHPESMRVLIGTSPHHEDFSIELTDLADFSNEAFNTEQVQFAVQEEGTYYLAFHVYSPADHRFIYLDNIFVERILFADLLPSAIVVEAQGCDFSQETPVNTTFLNNGLDPQQDFDVELIVTHIPTEIENSYTYHHNQILEPGATYDYEFFADLSLHGTYSVMLITHLAGDENPHNDSLTIFVNNNSINMAYENYFTDFNNVGTLQEMGWDVHTNSGGSTGWRMGQLSGHAHSPPNSLNMYRFEADPDDWAFSNCFTMEEGVYYRIHFYKATKGTNNHEEFTIHLMDEATPEGSVALLDTVIVNTFDYLPHEIVFQVPYSGEFHFGLYTDYTGPNTFQIYVDDFTVETVLDYDAAALDIIQQTWGCNAFTEQTPVQVVIENKGVEDLANAQVELTVSSPGADTLSYTLLSDQTLALTQRDTLQFYVDLSQLNTIFDLHAEVILAGDENPDNNVYQTQMRNTTVDLTTGDVYFNDFEMVHVDGHSALVDPKTGWWYENANDDYSDGGTPITWSMRKHANFAMSGEISMRSGRSLVNPADDWLFSNCLIMQEGENYLLTFYYTGRTTNATERMSVYLGDDQSSESMEQFLWHDTFSTGLNYQKAVVTFAPPTDGIYYIGFHAHSDADEGWIYMDDFEIKRNHDVDVALDNIEVMEDPCHFSDETPVHITFRNSGNQALDHPVTVEWHVTQPNGQISSSGQETVTQFMAVGQTESVEIFADLQMYGKYKINASISLPPEVNEPETGNNQAEIEFFSTLMNPEAGNIYITFEKYSELEETGWTVVDANNDGYTWNLGVNYTAFSYSGNRMMFYTFNPNSAADDWLFSSCAHLMPDTVYVASYFYRVFDGDYAESMRFGIASQPHPDDLVEVFDVKDEIYNYQYRRVSYAFTVPEEGLYYFAFHAISEPHRRYIFMDDFSLRKAHETDGSVFAIRTDTDPCLFSDETPVVAVIRNLGSQTLPESVLEIETSGVGEPQTITMNVPEIPVLGEAEMTFNLDLNTYGRHILDYELMLDGDGDLSNNQGTKRLYAIRVELPGPGYFFNQDFENIFALREAGWTSHNLNNDNRYWGLRVNDPGLAHSGGNYIVYFTGNMTQAANDWVISGCYILDPGREYKVAFYNRLGSGWHNLRLAAGTAPFPPEMNHVVWEETSMTQSEYEGYNAFGGIFQAEDADYHYFGIHQFSPPGQGSSIADDLVVIARPDILPLEDVEWAVGMEVTIEALGSDSLQWFADEELTQLLGSGTTLNYVIEEEGSIHIYAAENVYGIMGPADVVTLDVAVGIQDVDGQSALTLYPNPARDKIFVTLTEPFSGKINIRILNTMGETLIQTSHMHTNAFELDVSGLPKGTYFLVIQDRLRQWTGRFVIM